MQTPRFHSARALALSMTALSMSVTFVYGCEKEHGPPEAEPIRPVRVETVEASGGARSVRARKPS